MKVLDQLLGSTGLFTAVVTQLKFRNIGFVGLSLILLWILSPIGGQASLRVLGFSEVVDYRPNPMFAIDWNSTLHLAEASSHPDGADSTEAVFIGNTIFNAILAAPIDNKLSSMDVWGNIKIPMVEHLPGLAPDENGWYELDHMKLTYSALTGVPMSVISSVRNTTFTLET